LFQKQHNNRSNLGYLKGCKINPFGFGMLKNTNSRISERMETAALITLLDYLRRMEMINLSVTKIIFDSLVTQDGNVNPHNTYQV
jgi:hypothetical protein